MGKTKLERQMEFILEIDKAKDIFRQTYLSNNKRTENDAEHSWHLAMMAFTLSEYFGENLDLSKVVKMVLMHDLVEIYAGDTYCYDQQANADKAEREKKAAEKLYGILPEEQGKEYQNLWMEFEEGKTEEAKFAVILDRIQPVMLNYATNGRAWKEHGIYVDQVLGRNAAVLNGPKEIADFFRGILDRSVEKGYLKTR